MSKVISQRCWKTRQSVRFERTVSIRSMVVRVSIKVDSVHDQSFGRVYLWSGSKWQQVVAVPHQFIAGAKALCDAIHSRASHGLHDLFYPAQAELQGEALAILDAGTKPEQRPLRWEVEVSDSSPLRMWHARVGGGKYEITEFLTHADALDEFVATFCPNGKEPEFLGRYPTDCEARDACEHAWKVS